VWCCVHTQGLYEIPPQSITRLVGDGAVPQQQQQQQEEEAERLPLSPDAGTASLPATPPPTERVAGDGAGGGGGDDEGTTAVLPEVMEVLRHRSKDVHL
jgi:hypothetical protein